MKKVYLIREKYNQLVIPAIDSEDVCFKSKKECEKYSKHSNEILESRDKEKILNIWKNKIEGLIKNDNKKN